MLEGTPFDIDNFENKRALQIMDPRLDELYHTIQAWESESIQCKSSSQSKIK